MPLAEPTRTAYLRRLGLRPEEVTPPSAEGLRRLHRAHVERVPYETLWIALGRRHDVDPVAAAERHAHTAYGGFCFQLNGGLAALLESLGYAVQRHRGRVQPEPDSGPPAERPNHLALTVHGLVTATCPEGVWYVDVGLGDALRDPAPLRAGTWSDGGFRYALRPSSVCAGWRFVHDERGTFEGMDFEAAPARTEDFAAMNAELSTSAESGFVRVVTVERRTEEGVDALRGCVLTSVRPDGVRHEQVAAEDEWHRVLDEVFGMRLDDLSREQRAALWRRLRSDHAAWVAAGGGTTS